VVWNLAAHLVCFFGPGHRYNLLTRLDRLVNYHICSFTAVFISFFAPEKKYTTIHHFPHEISPASTSSNKSSPCFLMGARYVAASTSFPWTQDQHNH
jgi:hypothetical protein